MGVDERFAALLGGAAPPPRPKVPQGVQIPFEWIRVVNDRAFISGHGALEESGAPAPPFGKVPSEVSLEDAQRSALAAGHAALVALQDALGTLDRVQAWLTLSGFVNADPGFEQTTAVLNPVSTLLLDVFGEAGRHARTAIGVAALPLNLPVVISAEVLIRP